ncbi:probable serine/threonine-protein kinase DDB_G0278509 [Oscarella lobularis]|uniref:probable serine/threonine-protein kinase DDB_G0278509 n=1 Tax=Oscarella lobularis TaxID=121494 RepID=UPI003313270F
MAYDLFVQFGGNSGKYEIDLPAYNSLRSLTKDQLAKLRSTLLNSLLAFNVTNSYWLSLKMASAKELPLKRFRCSMASMSNGSVLMFGGLTVSSALKFQSLNDMWMLTINSDNVALWKSLSSACMPSRHCNVPLPRFNNIFKFSKDAALVFGGMMLNSNSSSSCLDQYVWQFHLKTSTWKKQDVRNRSSCLPPSRKNETAGTECFTAGDFIGEKLFISFRYQRPNCDLCNHVAEQKTETYILDYYSQDPASWIKLGSLPNNIIQSNSLNCNGSIVSIGTFSAVNFKEINTPSITILPRPGCPQGMFSPNFGQTICQFCGLSKFAAASSNACASCPIGLTTKFSNSSSIDDCECSLDYCKHGSCTIQTKVGSKTPSVLCSCNVGFTGKRCQYPTYFLIGAGAITLSSLFTLLAVAVYRTKRENANKASKLSQLQKTLSITENEIKILHRIDQDCRGGYSEVYKATFRGMKYVAVKNLQMDIAEIDKTVLLEFIREIEVMSLLSHKNIVKFFGAGRFDKSNDPFLVLEYVKRGSLRNILYDSPNLVTFRRKWQFALDVALGMEYLHNLKRPRIHRDLKTANLLVDKNWVVKIADFGCAKLLIHEGEPLRPKKRRSASSSVSESSSNLLEEDLLPENCMTVWHIGTLYWCAPEILLKQAYGTPADVYSFGIVLWEIMTRCPPYEEYDDMARCTREETKMAIAVGGRRPTIPPFVPSSIAQLIRICWATDQKKRPKFSQVVSDLQQIQSQLLTENEVE